MEYSKQRFNTTREWILDGAKKAVLEKGYGKPEKFFKDFAELLNWKFGTMFNAGQAGEILLLMKIARLKNDSLNPDTHIDIAGYVSCVAEAKGIKE